MEKIKKRVALYLPLGKKDRKWSGLGGAEKRLSYLISNMDSDRFQTYVVFRVYNDQERVKNALYNYIGADCTVRFLTSNTEAFLHLQKEKYDYVLYDDCMVKTIPGVLGARFGKSHCILIFVTEYYARWSFRKKWHALIMRFNGLLANSIDCLYPSSKSILEKKLKKNQVSVTPCSLPLIEKYINVGSVTDKQKLIVFAGRLVDEKNPMLLVDAAKEMKEDLLHNGYKIMICGAGPIEKDIVKSINDNDLQDVVNYVGPKNMVEVLPSALVFCSLQDNENYPSQSLLEAIASGCICIATDVGNTKSIVKPEFGILIEKNLYSLANAIRRIIGMSQEEQLSFSKKAREYAIGHFHPQKAIEHYEKLCGKT